MKPVASSRQQVITISPLGSVSGLQRKRGHGLDLRQLGHAQIQRASEVRWIEQEQAWAVFVFENNGSETPLTGATFLEWSQGQPCPAPFRTDSNDLLLFVDYEQAVEAEIVALDNRRLFQSDGRLRFYPSGNEKRPTGIGTSLPTAAAWTNATAK